MVAKPIDRIVLPYPTPRWISRIERAERLVGDPFSMETADGEVDRDCVQRDDGRGCTSCDLLPRGTVSGIFPCASLHLHVSVPFCGILPSDHLLA